MKTQLHIIFADVAMTGRSMTTLTNVNGKEYKQYDEMIRFILKIEQYFIENDDYNGIPLLPDFWTDIYGIYDNVTDEDERRWLFITVFTKLLEAYRHWSKDKDSLWREEKIKLTKRRYR